ncbi:MAG: hypothetical protein L0K86_04115, partial [Actinomycetia bacterium]|nr:hypothetical protein [Actinomycetes bacterium]
MNTPSIPRRSLLSVLSTIALIAGLVAAAPTSASANGADSAVSQAAPGTARKTVAKCANHGKYLARYFRGTKFRGKPAKKRCERNVRHTYSPGESPIGRRNFSATWTTRINVRARRFDFRAVADGRVAIRVDGKWLTGTRKDGKYVSKVRRLRRGTHKIQFRYVKRGRVGSVKAEYVRAPDRNAPRRPRRMRANAGEGSVALRWRGSHEVDLRGYRVFRNGKRLGEVTGTRYTDSKAKNGKTYRYWVRAIDYRGNDSRRSKVRRAVPKDTTAPATPRRFKAKPGDGAVTLTWKANSEPDLRRYIIRRDGKLIRRVGAGRTSYTDSNVQNGIPYKYTLVAQDKAGNKSAPTDSKSATPADTSDPAQPEGLEVTEEGGTAVLNWDNNTDPDFGYYKVYRSINNPNVDVSGNPIKSGLTESTFTDEDVANGSTYHYRVVAVDGNDNSSEASEIASITIGDQQDPAAPTGLTATGGDRSVALTWTASGSDDVNGYRIYRSTTPTVDISPANLVTGVDEVTTYDDNSVENDTTYYYAVVAVDQAGNESPSSVIASATPTDTTAPSAPTGLAATGGDGIVELTWDANGEPDISGYRVYRGDSADVATGPGATPITGTSLLPTPAYTDTPVENGTTYFYAVVAVDSHGNESQASASTSATPADTTPPAAPIGLAAEAGDGVVALDWDDSADADLDHYVVYRATAADLSDAAPVTEVTESAYDDEGVDNGTTYHYYVVAVDADDNSSPASETATATPVDANAPAAPTGLTATAEAAAIDLAWDDNAEGDLAGYNVFRSELPDVPTDGDPLNADPLSEATYTDDTAVAGTQYFYVVVAVDDAGNASAPSESASATIEVAPEVHEKFSFTTTEDTDVPAGYTKNDGSAWTDAAGLGWVEEASLDSAQHTPLDLTANTRVRAARPGVSELQRRL